MSIAITTPCLLQPANREPTERDGGYISAIDGLVIRNMAITNAGGECIRLRGKRRIYKRVSVAAAVSLSHAKGITMLWLAYLFSCDVVLRVFSLLSMKPAVLQAVSR